MQFPIGNSAHVRSPGRTHGAAKICLALLLAWTTAACDEDSTGPVVDRDLVVGTYNLSTLSFDPQGSLPAIDVRGRLNTNVQMILTPVGAVQIVYQDPISTLFTTIQGTFVTTATGVRLDFAQNSAYESLLLSRRMQLTFDAAAGTLTFTGDAPDGVDRSRLVELAPELEDEQLLDPTPGGLTVTFTR